MILIFKVNLIKKLVYISDNFEYITLRNILYLITKSVTSVFSDIYKDNIFSIKHDLIYLKA